MILHRLTRTGFGAALGPLVAAALLSAPQAHAKPTAPAGKDAKIGTYVQIINGESNHVFDTRRNYAAWVSSMKTGPTCKERGLRGPGSFGDSAPERFKKYRAALAKRPKLEADAAALQMVEALEELRVPQNEAADYYYKNQHLKDDCKKGQELHPKLVTAWTKYAQADNDVRGFVEKYQDARDADELASVEKKYGKRLRYHHRKLMIEGKALVRETDAQTAQAAPDVAALRAKLAAFVQTLQDAASLVAKEKQGKNSDALYQGGYEMLLKKAEWYRDAADELLKQLETPRKQPDGAERLRRASEQSIKAYNAMVEESNGVGYAKTMK
ncbi:MAG TPA: DUF3829 domain-containing protein [Polyangiaceae bacterium]|nr:DUF3829 domain-containing protein [Polyangiaceae bacterium]